MDVLDTDILIDIQRGHAPAVAWFTTLTELPSVPGFVVMELVQGAQNAQQARQVLWLFFRQHLFQHNDVYLLAGDEVVVTKAGKHTFGLDRFFSSVYQHPVPGLAFFSLALVSTTERRAFPVRVEQVVRTDEEKPPAKRKPLRKDQGARTETQTRASQGQQEQAKG